MPVNAESVVKLKQLIKNNPDNESHYVDLGLEYYQSGDKETAKFSWKEGIIYATCCDTLRSNLAVIMIEERDYVRASQLLSRVVIPSATTFNSWGMVKHADLDYEGAIDYFKKSVTLNPKFSTAYSNLGLMYQELNNFQQAQAYYLFALEADPTKLEVYYKLSELYLMNGDYYKGFELYEYRFQGAGGVQLKATLDTLSKIKVPRWGGQATDRLLLIAEQGFGDSLMMLRYINRIRDEGRVGNITIHCPPALNRIFTSQGVDVINDLSSVHENCDYTHYFLTMSLPYLFKEVLDTVSGKRYLDISSTLVRSGNNGKPSIGICWAGSNTNIKDATRSLPFEVLQPLFFVDEIQLVSLQKGLNVEGINNDINICGDFYDTAALVNSCQHIVSADTAVIHLAGSLGKHAFLLNRATSEWRWGVEGSKSVWYDSVEILRQKKLYDWQPVILELLVRLNALYKFGPSTIAKLEHYYLSRNDVDSALVVKSLKG